MNQMSPEQIKELLKIYYDIPQMIAEEFATIRNCEAEKDKITLSAVNYTGLPQSSTPGDRTANTALKDQARYFEDEEKRCYRSIADLREKRDWMMSELDRLDRTDRQILKLAYMGPSDRAQRQQGFRLPTWKEVAAKIQYSESRAYIKATQLLFRLSNMAKEIK